MFLDAQKNRLIETVLLSTHNMCYGWEMRKIIFEYTLVSGGLISRTHQFSGLTLPLAIVAICY